MTTILPGKFPEKNYQKLFFGHLASGWPFPMATIFSKEFSDKNQNFGHFISGRVPWWPIPMVINDFVQLCLDPIRLYGPFGLLILFSTFYFWLIDIFRPFDTLLIFSFVRFLVKK
jgi:hypothetical protein